MLPVFWAIRPALRLFSSSFARKKSHMLFNILWEESFRRSQPAAVATLSCQRGGCCQRSHASRPILAYVAQWQPTAPRTRSAAGSAVLPCPWTTHPPYICRRRDLHRSSEIFSNSQWHSTLVSPPPFRRHLSRLSISLRRLLLFVWTAFQIPRCFRSILSTSVHRPAIKIGWLSHRISSCVYGTSSTSWAVCQF